MTTIITLPTLLILPTAPVVGETYTVQTIIGNVPYSSPVYRGQVAHERVIKHTRPGGEVQTFRHSYDLGAFVDSDTGEVVHVEIEITETKRSNE
jgi:hypothetical protein